MISLLKKSSAWVPIVLSLGMLVFVVYILIFDASVPDPNADEGTPARLFQLWLVVEVLMIGFFAASWLPSAPRESLKVLALQVAAALLPVSIVFSLEL
ncbi:MAG TPA: hypothetical protein VJH91_03805 [Candidatus Paceibacterota bacterium]